MYANIRFFTYVTLAISGLIIFDANLTFCFDFAGVAKFCRVTLITNYIQVLQSKLLANMRKYVIAY